MIWVQTGAVADRVDVLTHCLAWCCSDKCGLSLMALHGRATKCQARSRVDTETDV